MKEDKSNVRNSRDNRLNKEFAEGTRMEPGGEQMEREGARKIVSVAEHR